MSTVLVLAPHPDDEVLGVGGTILRHLARNDTVHVVVCTRGRLPRFPPEQVEIVQTEARKVHGFLSLTGSHFLDLPAAELDTVPSADVNDALGRVFQTVKPDTVYLPHVGDLHRDHQVVFGAGMVCSRPTEGRCPRRILAYETVSESDWNVPPLTPAFVPNVFIEITEHISRKLTACSMYASQVRPAPDHRSIESLRALSVMRGHTVGVPHAEAFMLIREILVGQVVLPATPGGSPATREWQP